MTDVAQRVVAIAATVGLIILILELVRRKRLMERYALLWLFCSTVLLILAAWRGLLSTISFDIGIHYPPALLFAAAFGLELLLLLHFSLAVSSLTDQNKVLAQRMAILQRRLDEQAHQLAALSSGPPEENLAENSESELRTKLSRTG
ncbi:MAG: hypothetical protein QOF83_235 [Solirubrobacteraceae bacterium]|jgi:hypothetical protein|nr:hypothetical protein [Solirubrobacteraceae bacterium]